MTRSVLVTGLGPVSALGLGIDANWQGAVAGDSAIAPLEAWDSSGLGTTLAGEIKDFSVRNFVPKTYRKATKVMARDIELAVAAADLAVRDASLNTKGIDPDSEVCYAPPRVGAQIGAGLIAADINELTMALDASRQGEGGAFDIHRWGREGMQNLTPLWLLKYLPNMLACHVTIIHDCQGPSNTITCQEASSELSIGEALRVIQRGNADAALCGGAESKLNPMGFMRQLMTDRYNKNDDASPTTAVRPFSKIAAGCVIGEGGGIVVLEAEETFAQRAGDNSDARAYARLIGFGAAQSINRATRNLKPDPSGRAIAAAITAALNDGGVAPADIDLVVPFGIADPDYDRAEAAGLQGALGDELSRIPVISTKPLIGNCAAGAGAIDLCIAAKAVAEQQLPATVNCDDPIAGLNCKTAPAAPADINCALTYSVGLGGQIACLVLQKVQ